jgi:hypothetical protein
VRRNFADALAFGSSWEDRVYEMLIADGFLVERTHQLKPEGGHGPRLHGNGSLTPPDFRICKLGMWVSVEVRSKSTASMGRITRELEHGIDWDSWVNLRDYEKRANERTYLVICEDNTAEVLAQRISTIKPRGDCPTEIRPGYLMAYFTRSQLGPWRRTLNRAVGLRPKSPTLFDEEPYA